MLLGEASTVPETPLGEDNWNLVFHVSWALPNVPFSFADSNLHLFVIIYCITAFLSSENASIKLWKLRLVLGTLKLQDPLDTSGECVTALDKSPLTLY